MLLTRQYNTTLGIDIVRLNRSRFLYTYFRIVKYCTASEIQDTETPTLIVILKTVKAIYQIRGSNIKAMVIFCFIINNFQT